MGEQLKEYEKYALDIKHLLWGSGLWPARDSVRIMKCLSVIYTAMNLVFSAALVNWVCRHSTSVILAVRAFSVVAGCLTSLMKQSLFWGNRKAIVNMHETLEETFRKDLAQPEFQSEMLSPLKFFYVPTVLLSRSCILLPLAIFFKPTISIAKQIIHGDSPIIYRMPCLTQYPWDNARTFGIFAFHYAFEFTAGMSVCLIHASTDSAFGFYIFQMGTQFRALSHRMKNLKSSDDYRAVIEECVNRHQVLTNCRDTLEHVYGPIVISFMITSAMSLCSNIFLISQMNTDHMGVAILYIVEKLLQAFLYGWFGLFLTMQTEDFRESVYNSGWPGSGQLSFMTNILIMLMCKPLTVSAMSFSTVSLDMFAAIVNTALSYFFLLKTIEDTK